MLDWLKMVDGVEPLAHENAFPHLDLDLLLAERLQHNKGNHGIKGSRVQPARKKSCAHKGSEVALSDVDHVGGGEESAEAPGGLTDTFRVVQSVDDRLIQLPVVVIHLLSSIK